MRVSQVSNLSRGFQKRAVSTKNLWLFDIKKDPGEDKDLSEKMPEKVVELLEKLAMYNETVVPNVDVGKDSKAAPQLHGGYWGSWR